MKTLADFLREPGRLVPKLIAAELLARRGEGPLARPRPPKPGAPGGSRARRAETGAPRAQPLQGESATAQEPSR